MVSCVVPGWRRTLHVRFEPTVLDICNTERPINAYISGNVIGHSSGVLLDFLFFLSFFFFFFFFLVGVGGGGVGGGG